MATARLGRARVRAPVAGAGRGRAWDGLIGLVGALYGLTLALGIVAALAPARLTLALATPYGGPTVGWVRPDSNLWNAGVRPGDRVLLLDGRVPTPRDAGLWAGERLAVRAPDGRTLTVRAAEVSRGRDALPLLLLSPMFFLLGTLVVLRAPHPRAGRATYALFGSAAYALALAPAADADELPASLVEFVLVPLFAAFFLHFFLIYPTPHDARLRHAALAAPLAVGALYLSALAWPALVDLAVRLRLLTVLACLLLGVGLVVYGLVRAPKREGRRGLAIISAGTAVSILPFVALYLAPTVLHHAALASPEHAALGLAVLPVSFAYAILRHQALDARLLQRWLVYGLLWGLLIASYALIAYTLEHDTPIGGIPEPARSTLLATALALLAAGSVPLHTRLRRRLDHAIFKDSYDYRASLQGLSQQLSLAGDLDALGGALVGQLCHLMNLDFVALLVRDERTGDTMVARGIAGACPPALLATLAAAGASDIPHTVRLAGRSREVLLAPLRTPDRVVGQLCLGPKAMGEPFRAEDRALLITLSGHLAAAVRNAQLVTDLSDKVDALDALNERLERAQEEERASISADLHDEPLQTALALHHQLAAIGTPVPDGSLAAPIALSRALAAQLRALCTSMRPAALDDLGLHAALDQLARDLNKRADVSITLDADPEVAELGLPPQAELVLYRATQEALNNCLRHAGARIVRVSLQRHGDGVRLLVADDGAGFTVPARLESLALDEHHGLAGLSGRVRHIGGRLHVISASDEGTTVQVDLLLPTPTTGTLA